MRKLKNKAKVLLCVTYSHFHSLYAVVCCGSLQALYFLSSLTSLPGAEICVFLMRVSGSVVIPLFPPHSTGIFILNLVCRDLELKASVLAGLKAAFPLLYVRRIEGEVNEILFCQLQPEQKLATPELLEMAQALERTLRKPGQAWDDTYVLSDMLKTVKIV